MLLLLQVHSRPSSQALAKAPELWSASPLRREVPFGLNELHGIYSKDVTIPLDALGWSSLGKYSGWKFLSKGYR